MYGFEEKCVCPICNAEYKTNPGACACGFEELTFIPFYMNDELKKKYADAEKEQLFRIFKYSKQVYLGEKPYKKSELVTFDREDGKLDVDEALERRGLAYVDLSSSTNDKPTVASDGILAMRPNVRALILNVDEIRQDFMDECGVDILLLGADVKRIEDGGFKQYHPLRYIWVDGKNQHFTAEDNILYNKDKTRIVAYARSRPGKEFTVPPTVKYLESYSFFMANNLEKLYLPRTIRLSDKAIMPSNIYHRVDGELQKMKPSFSVIYYNP